ncbi:MAG: alpha/beta fold hydrolase [Micromonosporaceae bacterium]
MDQFSSYDGTLLAYHEQGSGTPLICLPGGPACASAYLGDLGGLAARLIRLDLRGSGDSAVPADPATYQCVRMVDDVEVLRQHLGLERVNVLGHSAGANLAMLYAARHPERVRRLLLVTPSWRCTDLKFDYEEWFAGMRQRSGEPWFAEAYAAAVRTQEGTAKPDDRAAMAPLFYGRWDAAAAADYAFTESTRAPAAQEGFGAGDDAFGSPEKLREDLRGLAAPVLVLGGGLDPAPPPRLINELAQLFPQPKPVIQPNAGHTPWLDDPAAFTSVLEEFLS